jgi:hypothetical protein
MSKATDSALRHTIQDESPLSKISMQIDSGGQKEKKII